MRALKGHAVWMISLAAILVAIPARAADPPASAERVVRALERAWLDAYEKRDAVAMKRIVADDFLISFPNGSQQTKTQIVQGIEASQTRPPSGIRFHTEEVSARTFGNTVILTGIVVTTTSRGALRSRYTDTYVRGPQGWQVVASHLSNVPKGPETEQTSADTGRVVRNHVLSSPRLPRMKADVDPRLEYVGSLEFLLKESAMVERHVFVERNQELRPMRMLIFQFESLLPDAKGAYTFGLENPTRLGAHDFQTQTGSFGFDQAAAARPGAEAERTREFLAGKEIRVSGEKFFVTRYARIVDTAKRAELIVFYLENERGLRSDADRPAQETPQLLRDVAARARGAFSIRDDRE